MEEEFEISLNDDSIVEEHQEEQVVEPQEESIEQEPSTRDALSILNLFGINSGDIPTDEGTIHISELNEDDKLDYIYQLIEAQKEKYAQYPEFNDNDKQIIEDMKKHNLSLTEYMQAVLDNNAEKIAEQIHKQYEQSPVQNIDDLNDDQIMLLHLQNILEDATEEEINEELEQRKSSKNFNKEVTKLRDTFKQANEEFLQQQELQKEQELRDKAQQHINEVAHVLNNTPSILGFELDRNTAQLLLEAVAVPDEQYNTHFSNAMQEPENQIKALWFLENEDKIMKYLDDMDKKVKDAYEKGRNDVIKGKFPTKPISNNSTIKPSSKPDIQEDDFGNW